MCQSYYTPIEADNSNVPLLSSCPEEGGSPSPRRERTAGRQPEERSQPGGVGLSHSAYLAEKQFDVRFSDGGNLIEARELAPQEAGGKKKGGGKRGRVAGFSPASRRRLRKVFAQFASAVLRQSLFVTLTYPSQYPDCGQAREHRRALEKRILRKWKQAGIIWRMELQKRGAPHFHMIVLGVPAMPKDWLSRCWFEVVGSGDEKHLRAGTQVQRIMHERQARSYLEKYISKDEDGGQVEGRSWGYNRNCESYIAPTVTVRLSGADVALLFRRLDGILRARLRMARRPRRRKLRRKSFLRRVRFPDGGSALVAVRSFRWFLDGASIIRRLPDICAW